MRKLSVAFKETNLQTKFFALRIYHDASVSLFCLLGENNLRLFEEGHGVNS